MLDGTGHRRRRRPPWRSAARSPGWPRSPSRTRRCRRRGRGAAGRIRHPGAQLPRTGGAARCAAWPWPGWWSAPIAGYHGAARGPAEPGRARLGVGARPQQLLDRTPAPGAWQAPFALVIVAVRGRDRRCPGRWSLRHRRGVRGALATIGAPAAFGLPWWSPLLVGGAVALGYGVGRRDRTTHGPAYARAGAAARGVAVRGRRSDWPGPGRPRLGLTLVVAGRHPGGWSRPRRTGARSAPRTGSRTRATGGRKRPPTRGNLALDDTGMPRHRAQIGGAATLARSAGRARRVRRRSPPTRAGASRSCSPPRWPRPALSLALLALLGKRIPQYLPWATVGVVGGATVTALGVAAHRPADRAVRRRGGPARRDRRTAARRHPGARTDRGTGPVLVRRRLPPAPVDRGAARAACAAAGSSTPPAAPWSSPSSRPSWP